MSNKILILGGSGMLGSMLVDFLSRDKNLDICATVRDEATMELFRERLNSVNWRIFNTAAADFHMKLDMINEYDWVINAISLGSPFIRKDNAFEVERAIWINSLLPHFITRQSKTDRTKIVQIATERVFSGIHGQYTEIDNHDPTDVYGKTRSLGEVPEPNIHHIRCAFFGPEPGNKKYLLYQLLNQPENSRIDGFTNHYWNGLTSLHVAKICQTIINRLAKIRNVQHIVPADKTTEFELLKILAASFQRRDIKINKVDDTVGIDQTLATVNAELNRQIWSAAGYEQPPTITQMVEELANYDFRCNDMIRK